MRTGGARESDNIEDRRGMSGGGRRLAVGGGVGTMVLALVVYLLGGDPTAVLEGASQGPVAEQGPQAGQVATAPDKATQDELTRFVRVVLADTEDVWRTQLQAQIGKPYRDPTLVLFAGGVDSACGSASSATGPFYCPTDEKLYIDLQFFRELGAKYQAPGDFAQAYVIAHEVGHHIQKIMGITTRVHASRGQMSPEEYNRLSVRLELQADFLAGVWAHHAQRTRGVLEPGDIEEALGAASAVGDDTLQRKSQGRVVPDSFTHGSSSQRKAWFDKGFRTGDVRQGDTFSLPDPQ